MKRFILASVLCTLALTLPVARSAAAAKPDDSKAEGRMSVNGHATPLRYAYAYQDSDRLWITLCDAPLTLNELVHFPDSIRTRREAGKLHAIRFSVSVNDQNQLEWGDTDIQHSGFKNGWTPSIRGKDKMEFSVVDDTHIAGRARTDKPLKFGETGDVLQYDITYSAFVHPWEAVKEVIFSPGAAQP